MARNATQLITEMYKELVGMLVESGGCDHSVGICNCEQVQLVEDAAAWLKKHGVDPTIKKAVRS
jgi:hypothetical protein